MIWVLGMEKQYSTELEKQRKLQEKLALEIAKRSNILNKIPEFTSIGGGGKPSFNLYTGLAGPPKIIEEVNESIFKQIDLIQELGSNFQTLFLNIGGGFKSMVGVMIDS
jgi:hypothetical protein